MPSAPEALGHSVESVGSEIPRLSILRIVFSFPVMLSSLLVVLMVLTVRDRFNDPDMWWHLKTGELIWNTHSIPRVDQFSFTTNRHSYVPHEWLSQITIYGAWKLAGYQGLMLWLCVWGSLLLVGSYALAWLYSGNAKVALLGALITWVFSTIGLAVRPQLIGYCFLVFEILVIHLGRSRNSRWFFILPPLFALWVNCHGSFFLGLIVLCVVLGCSFLEIDMGLVVSQPWDHARRKTLVIAAAFSIAALFANPIGLQQVLYPMDTLLKQQVSMLAVSEWQPLTFGDSRSFLLIAVCGLILLLPALRRTSLRVDELLLLLIGAGFAAAHQRMLFVFGILAAPVCCRMLSDAWDNYEPSRDLPVANGVLIACCIAGVYLGFPTARSLSRQVELKSPVKAVNFLRSTGLTGRMLNQYEYGGYLIWAAPEFKVFIDGRADVFDWTGVLLKYGAWATLQADPRHLLEEYRVDFCLLSRDAPMSRVLPLLPGWTKVYSDDLSSVFASSRRYSRF